MIPEHVSKASKAIHFKIREHKHTEQKKNNCWTIPHLKTLKQSLWKSQRELASLEK